MKITKFILQDNVDKYFQDLIIFEEPVEEEELEKVINNIKKKLMGEYSFDDIYFEIKNNFKIKEDFDLYQIKIIEY